MQHRNPDRVSVFVYPKIATVLLDRVAHHCHIVDTGNGFCQCRRGKQAVKSRIKSREQTMIMVQKENKHVC